MNSHGSMAAVVQAILGRVAWYDALSKPAWTPPKWAFPLIWTVLYALYAASGWLVWQDVQAKRPDVWALYAGSLGLNLIWPALFFGLKRTRWALADAISLFLSLVAIVAVFWSIRPLAAMLNAPYLCWAALAVVLNKRLIDLNPHARQLDVSRTRG